MKIGDPTRTPKPLVWEWGVYKKTAKGLGGGLMIVFYSNDPSSNTTEDYIEFLSVIFI